MQVVVRCDKVATRRYNYHAGTETNAMLVRVALGSDEFAQWPEGRSVLPAISRSSEKS